VQSRIQRVTSEAELAQPGAEGVIRVVVVDGVRVVLRTVAVMAALLVLVALALAVNFVVDLARPGVDADAVFAVELMGSPVSLDGHSHVVALRDGTVVVGSDSGRLAFVTPAGAIEGTLDLPLPAPRAELAGLAPHPRGGFYASLGGAIIQVSGPPFVASSVGPPLPLDPTQRVYDAIAVDDSGQLYAVTKRGDFVVVAADGSASGHQPTGVPTFGQPLELAQLALAPDGRALLRRRYGDEVWWFDRARAALTPLAHGGASPESTVAPLADGSLVYDTRHALVRLAGGTARPLDLTRPGSLTFDRVVPDGQGGVLALSLSGTLVRYDAQRLAP
jgi:hypothetical protein